MATRAQEFLRQAQAGLLESGVPAEASWGEAPGKQCAALAKLAAEFGEFATLKAESTVAERR